MDQGQHIIAAHMDLDDAADHNDVIAARVDLIGDTFNAGQHTFKLRAPVRRQVVRNPVKLIGSGGLGRQAP